jgi:hypothetical protein
MLPNISITTMIAIAGATAAVVLAPGAYADGGDAPCADEGSATVCQQPGNANVIATPPEQAGGAGGASGGSGNSQNGPYGPSGSQPPVG